MDLYPRGVGVNLRLDYIDEFLSEKPRVPFLEVIADNWLSPGPHHQKLERLRQDYEISFHCVGMNLGGTDPLDKKYFSSIKNLMDRYSPFHVSDHLCFQAEDGIYLHDLLPFPFSQSFLKNTTSRIHMAQELLASNILVENISYYCQFKSSDLAEYDFINKITQMTGAEILLDLNNLWINSRNHGTDASAFLNCIDWEKVGEIHFAAGEKQRDVIVDNHGAPPEAELLHFIKPWISKFKDLPIIYERDAHLPPFKILLQETHNLQQGLIHVG